MRYLILLIKKYTCADMKCTQRKGKSLNSYLNHQLHRQNATVSVAIVLKSILSRYFLLWAVFLSEKKSQPNKV